MEDPVYLSDEHVLSRMLASETRQAQDMQSYFESRLQRDFNENDRRELAIWMRDVCQAEECQPDIFPLSMLIVDRFLSFVRTKRTQLQLLGAVALLLASKLRQTSQIPAKYLIYYTQDLITLNELKTWELFVLTTLKWDLALITPVDYLDIYIRRMKIDDEQLISDIEDRVQHLINECFLEFKYSILPPSMIAWVCILQTLKSMNLGSEHLNQVTTLKYGPTGRQVFSAPELESRASSAAVMAPKTEISTTQSTTTTTSSSSPSSSSSSSSTLTTPTSNSFENDELIRPFDINNDSLYGVINFYNHHSSEIGTFDSQTVGWNQHHHHQQQQQQQATLAFN